MKLAQDAVEIVKFLRDLLEHLELLMRENKPLSLEEAETLRQLGQALPPEIGLVRQHILPRVEYLLGSCGSSKKSGKNGNSESAMNLSRPKSLSVEHCQSSEKGKLSIQLPAWVQVLAELRTARERRLRPAPMEIA